MNVHALLGLSALMSLVASVVAASLWAWPRLLMMNRSEALASPESWPYLDLAGCIIATTLRGEVPALFDN